MGTGEKSASMLLRKFDSVTIGGESIPYSDWVISSEEPDTVGDIVLLDGIDLTDWQKSNCPVLFCHDDKLPVGSSKMHPNMPMSPDIRVEGNELIARCYHHSDTEIAADVASNVQRGILNQASITFAPIKARRPTPEEHAKGGKRVFEKAMLKEWSIVPMGANTSTRRLFTGSAYAKMADPTKQLLIRKGFAMADENTTESPAMKPSAQMTQDLLDGLSMIAASIHEGIGSLEHDKNAKALSKAMGAMCKAAMGLHESVSAEYPESVKMPEGFDEMAKAFMGADEGETTEEEEEGMEAAESDPGDSEAEEKAEEDGGTVEAEEEEAGEEDEEDTELEKKIDLLTTISKSLIERMEAIEEFNASVRKSIRIRK
jgi:HK97 family phage prohead protease